jgi:hypothetical protein
MVKKCFFFFKYALTPGVSHFKKVHVGVSIWPGYANLMFTQQPYAKEVTRGK